MIQELFGSKTIAHAKAYLKSKGFAVPANLGQLLKHNAYDNGAGALPRAQQVQEAAARLSTYKIRSRDRQLGVSVDLTGDDAVVALRAIKAQGQLKKSATQAVPKSGRIARMPGDIIGYKGDLSRIYIPKSKIGNGVTGRDIAVARLSRIAQNKSEMDYIRYKAPQFRQNLAAALNMDNVNSGVEAIIKNKVSSMSDIQAHNMGVDMMRGAIPGIKSIEDLYYNIKGDADRKVKQMMHYFGIDFNDLDDTEKRYIANQFDINMSDITDKNGNVNWAKVEAEYNTL